MTSNRPPDPENATASLIINGIALTCSTEDQKFQAAFLRADNHDFTLDISEIAADGNETRISHTLNLDPNQQIYISVNNPVQETSTLFESAKFDRLNSTRDFRFVADVDGEVHESPRPFKNPKEVDVTLLTVNNGNFYSRRLVGPVKKVQVGSNTASEFGMIASLIGADLSCAEGAGSIVLQNADGANAIELEKKDGVRYQILFKNTCPVPVAANTTDFVLCYKVLEAPEDGHMDLQPVLAGSMSGDDSCNSGRVSDDKDLTQLLSIPTAPQNE